MQAILADSLQPDCPYQICLVLSNQAQAAGLAIAQAAGIAATVLEHQNFPDRESFDRELLQIITAYQADFVALAGFMRILSPLFVQHLHGRLLNIHPSLLPEFKGLHTHERALAAGVTQHGASVHFVTEALDSGPLIAQAIVPVLPDDDAKQLAARVLEQEHQLYPKVLRALAQGRLELRGNQAYLDGQPALLTPL